MDMLLVSSPFPRASLAPTSARTSLRSSHAGRPLLAAPRRVSLPGGPAASSKKGRGAVRVVAEVGEAEMERGRAAMRQWWQAQQAAKAGQRGGQGAVAVADGEGEGAQASMDAARAEMRAWWAAQQAGKGEKAGMDAARAQMRTWWMEQQQAKAMDAARAAMRQWWAEQQQGKAMDAGRAEMRQWWVQQQQGKAMDAARAEMRQWWMAQLAAKRAAVEDESRAQLNAWAVGKWRAVLGEAEQQAEEARLEAMEAGRAEMRQWWTNQLEEKAVKLAEQAAAAVEAEAAMYVTAAADFGGGEEGDLSEDELIASDDEEQMEVAARMVDLSDMERAVIEREMTRYRARREAKRAFWERDVQRAMDRNRKAMREWWLQQWGAKQRANGWGDNPPVWRLKLTAGSADTPGGSTALEDVEVSGKGVTLGLLPQPEDGSQPIELHLKGVSFAHAVVYGKDKYMGFGSYKREYFIADIGSTTGTFLNGKLLGVNAPRKLASGDVIKLGPEVEFVVTDPSLSP
ncbi:unnamed protein product [Closterium sp. NIES-64]|nr:unnamed protein product [Closterium sp. NIES-64]